MREPHAIYIDLIWQDDLRRVLKRLRENKYDEFALGELVGLFGWIARLQLRTEEQENENNHRT
jgi:hypothetical protein